VPDAAEDPLRLTELETKLLRERQCLRGLRGRIL